MSRQRIISLGPDDVWNPGQNDTPEKKLLRKLQDLGILSTSKETKMCMRNYKDERNETEFVGYRKLTIEVPGENREYIFVGEYYEFRGRPCEFRIDYCDLFVWDDDGNILDTIDVTQDQIPAMWADAERIGVEEYERLDYE